jgi:AcrR family transcriptional regulator
MDRIDHILGAAASLFARYGYEGVTMRHVADAARVTMSSLYYHFASKEELHDEVTQQVFERFFARIVSTWKAQPQQTIVTLMTTIYDLVLDDPTNFLLMQHDLHYYDEGPRVRNSRTRYREFFELFKSTLNREAAPVSDADVIVVAALISGVLELVQADQRGNSPSATTFRQDVRSAMVKLLSGAYP